VAELPTPDHGRIEHRLRRDLHDTGELIAGSAVTSDVVADARRLGAAFRARRIGTTILVLAGLALAVLATLLSPALGRAEPTGNYRPPLPPDTIELGCYPLPAGFAIDFPYQVRTDGDVHGRRVLTLQWDELGAAEVRRRLHESLRRAGLPRSAATVTPFPDLPADAIVRGTVVLRLPVVPLSNDEPACRDPQTTKRFPDDWAPSTEYG